MKTLFGKFKGILVLSVVSLLVVGLNSCKDEVDESDLYTFSGETISSFLKGNDRYSKYYGFLEKVKLSKRTESTISQLLSARGNYTVFAPTNDALDYYLDSIGYNNMKPVEQDSVAEYLVVNSIIDNKDHSAYMSTDFIEGALDETNMNDRYITINFREGKEGAETLVNDKSIIISKDNKTINGVVHGVDNVVDLSRATLSDLIEQTPNLRIFSYILKQTGWADSLHKYRDDDYEAKYANTNTKYPQHRYYGYTAFVETDNVFDKAWGLSLEGKDLSKLETLQALWPTIVAKCKEHYPNALSEDPKAADNAVNMFISYHLLPELLTWEKIIIHHAEMGYGYATPEVLSVDCFEYYETMKHKNNPNRRLLKFVEGKDSEGKRINRKCTYDYGKYGNEMNVKTVEVKGIRIMQTNADTIKDNEGEDVIINYTTNALNGFYYPVEEVLYYNEKEMTEKVLNERVRWDLASLLPDLMTNGYRLKNNNDMIDFPRGYFSTMTFTAETEFRYNPYYTSTVDNYQGDEFNILGQYDMTLRLPPVPYEGTWEIRWAAPHYPGFGMMQLYIGKDPLNLEPVGLPIALHLEVSNETIGYQHFDDADVDAARENDKNMRNRGWMTPPYHDGIKAGGKPITESMRNSTSYAQYPRLRYIVCQRTMKPSETYYLRMKSVLESTSRSGTLDYMEYCPKSIYAGTEQEDIW